MKFGEKRSKNSNFLQQSLFDLVFYGVWGPSVARNFILAACQKTWRFTWFWGPGGGPNGKNHMLKVFEHRWAKCVVTMAQRRANIGPT